MNRILRFLASDYGLFFHLALLIVIPALLLYRPITKFTIIDPAPQIIQQSNERVPQVEVGFALENFAEFDIIKNKFVAEGIIWFVFDPKLISLEKLSAFSFNKGALLEKTGPTISSVNNKTMAQFHIRVQFTTNLYYHYFPIDDHRIYLELKNDTLSAKDVQFISHKGNFTQSADIEEAGWVVVGHNVEAGYGKTLLKNSESPQAIYTPEVLFSLDYDRSGIHLLVIILMPLLLLFFAALAVFLVRVPSAFDASNTFMGSVFALVGYLFVVETISPQVGYMMLSNYLYLSVLICTFLIAILSWGGNKLSPSQRALLGTGIEILLLALLGYFIVLWR